MALVLDEKNNFNSREQSTHMVNDLEVVRDNNGKGIGFRSPSRVELTRRMSHQAHLDAVRRGEWTPPPPAPMFTDAERARYEAVRSPAATPAPVS